MLPLDELARMLDALDRESAPAAVRLDDGPAIGPSLIALPSAFNPPTLAHVALLDTGRAASGAGEAAALLTTRNVAKGVHGATLAQRIQMLLVSQDAHTSAVLVCNAARFVDQAAALRALLPGRRLDFIAGFDTLVRIFDPRYYSDMVIELEGFFAAHRLVVTNRGEFSIQDIERFIERPDIRPFSAALVPAQIDEAAAALSSTDARLAAAAGVHEAVPAAVAAYIARHGLYREDEPR